MNLLTIFIIIIGLIILFSRKITEGFTVKTDGYILNNVLAKLGIESNKESTQILLNDLNNDIKDFVQPSISLDQIPYSTNDPSNCKRCYNFLPGSPGASQYNYGFTTDCGCQGVTGDLISGKNKCSNCDKKCGVKYLIDKDEAGKAINYSKSTPEVINLDKNNYIPNHLISQLHPTFPNDNIVLPSNQVVNESPCNFKSEKTNLEQYFKANPDLFLPGDLNSVHKPYVPYTDAWVESSDCYNNIKYMSDQSEPSHFIVNKVH